MPNHIRRVFHYRITADEINKIVGNTPKYISEGEVEFINLIVEKELKDLRQIILDAIIHGKGEWERFVKRQENLRIAMGQDA